MLTLATPLADLSVIILRDIFRATGLYSGYGTNERTEEGADQRPVDTGGEAAAGGAGGQGRS